MSTIEQPRQRHHSSHSHSHERRTVKLPNIPSLTFGPCLGSGHFSRVYQGVYKSTRPVAIKVIERGSERIVEREINLLTRLRGLPNIIQLYEVITTDCTLLVFELLNGISEKTFYREITLEKFRYFLQSLLIALKSAHDAQIVHRDVNLGNILISPDWRQIRLIDWGCGVEISDHMSHRAGLRSVRSIEMLLEYNKYGSAPDMWAIGVLIFTTLCGGKYPWGGESSWETLVGITRFVGKQVVLDLAKQYGTEIPDEIAQQIHGIEEKKFSECFSRNMGHLMDPKLIDLMERLLAVKIEERPGADAALAHPFFST